MNRRGIIKILLVGSTGLSLPFGMLKFAFGQSTSLGLSVSQLADDIYLVEGAGGNIIVHVGNDGLTLVDGGSASMTQSLLSFLESELGSASVSTLFNTHWHLDQTGSNEFLASTGTEIIAHENTRLWMGTEIVSRWENDRIYPPRNEQAYPTKTFYYDSESLNLDGTKVEYGHLPQAHTDGDIYVYFPEQNIMVGGGVISGDTYPVFDYSSRGWIGGVVNALQTMLDMTNEDTLYIPASGAVRSRADLEAQMEMCRAVAVEIGQNFFASGTYSEFLSSAPTLNFDQRWGDPALFLETAYVSSLAHTGDMRRFR